MLALNDARAAHCGNSGDPRKMLAGEHNKNFNTAFDRGVQVGVTRTLAAIMRGILHARRDGWCHVCDAPIAASTYLLDVQNPTPAERRKAEHRRRESERRAATIMAGGIPS